MYQVLIDGRDLYYPGDEEYTVSDAIVKLQLNDSGTFECNVPVTNPEYANIKNRISMIQVLKDNKEIFYGEVRESEKDFYRTKQVYAVGELAFLFDSIQPPARYQNITPRQLLETWLNIHNEQVEDKKKFYVGMVTVQDPNDSLYRYTNYETTLDCIRGKLCDKLGGYLRIRKENGKRYLDLVTLQEYGKICEQAIEFGENLLDYAENVSASDLYTACIPQGARLDESPIEGLEAYIDITSVNDGKNYVYIEEAVNTYGWNRCVVSWDDVTQPENLKTKAENWLKDAQYESMVLNVTAADLSVLNVDLDSFCLGDYIPVYSAPHGMDRLFPVQSMELHLQSPADDRLQLGTTVKLSFTQQNQGKYQNLVEQLEQGRQVAARLQSAIDNATAMMTGSKGGYKVTEYDENGLWLRDLYMNAPSKEQATMVMQINMNGIGFSDSGYDGPYKTAWTIDGQFAADCIVSGSMSADRIHGGELLSNNYNADTGTGMRIDLDNGVIDASKLNLSDYLKYDETNTEIPLQIGGWQIKFRDIDNEYYKGPAEYWDTLDTQENGIGAKGPWIVWGGWNGQNAHDLANYNFVVTDDGTCKAMDWVTGSRAELKKDIRPYDGSGLQQVLNSAVYWYRLKNEKSKWKNKDRERVGFIIGEDYPLSDDLLDGSGGNVDLYAAIAIAYKAIQELSVQIENLKDGE
nr:phage tail spike protein [uncultured Sellimonas sp.]